MKLGNHDILLSKSHLFTKVSLSLALLLLSPVVGEDSSTLLIVKTVQEKKLLTEINLAMKTNTISKSSFYTDKEYLNQKSRIFCEQVALTLKRLGAKDNDGIVESIDGMNEMIQGAISGEYTNDEVIEEIGGQIESFIDENSLDLEMINIPKIINLIPSVSNYRVSFETWFNNPNTTSEDLYLLANKYKSEKNTFFYEQLNELGDIRKEGELLKQKGKSLKQKGKSLKQKGKSLNKDVELLKSKKDKLKEILEQMGKFSLVPQL